MSSNGNFPSTSINYSYPTILFCLAVSEMAYDTYNEQGSLSSEKPTDLQESTLTAAGWTQVPTLPSDMNPVDSYQGVAFYKVVDGATEVVIGNRGSQTLHDFLVSDRILASNGTPRATTTRSATTTPSSIGLRVKRAG